MAEVISLASAQFHLLDSVQMTISELRGIKQPPGEISELIARLTGLEALLQQVRGLGLSKTFIQTSSASKTPTLEEAIQQARRLLEDFKSFRRDLALDVEKSPSRISNTRRIHNKSQTLGLIQQITNLSLSITLLVTMSLHKNIEV